MGVNKTLDKVRQEILLIPGKKKPFQELMSALRHLHRPEKQGSGLRSKISGPFPQNDQGNRYPVIDMDYFT
jgi:hypothetical protein